MLVFIEFCMPDYVSERYIFFVQTVRSPFHAHTMWVFVNMEIMICIWVLLFGLLVVGVAAVLLIFNESIGPILAIFQLYWIV